MLFSAGKRPFRRYTVLRQPISYFCLMKSPRPSLAEKAAGKGVFGLSGGLYAQYQGAADVNMGRGAIVIGLAAVIIGEALFSRIFHNFALKLVSVSLGAIIYYIVIQLVLTLGFDANLLKLLSASVVAVFLAVPYWKSKYFAKPAAKKAQKEDAKNA